MKKLISIFFILSFSGCAPWGPFYYLDQNQIKKVQERRMERLRSIDLEDGVSQMEASILGNEYFLRYVSSCGITKEAKDALDHWEVWANEGITAVPLKDSINIDKSSGVISMKDKQTVTDPLETFGIQKK